MREGMSLIDRFDNGGNRARPAALDILVVVLDGVVRRMRQQYATRQANLSELRQKWMGEPPVYMGHVNTLLLRATVVVSMRNFTSLMSRCPLKGSKLMYQEEIMF